MSTPAHYALIDYGFEWGSLRITRCFSDENKGWVTLLLETPKHQNGNAIQIYVTKCGKVKVNGIEIKS